MHYVQQRQFVALVTRQWVQLTNAVFSVVWRSRRSIFIINRTGVKQDATYFSINSPTSSSSSSFPFRLIIWIPQRSTRFLFFLSSPSSHRDFNITVPGSFSYFYLDVSEMLVTGSGSCSGGIQGVDIFSQYFPPFLVWFSKFWFCIWMACHLVCLRLGWWKGAALPFPGIPISCG